VKSGESRVEGPVLHFEFRNSDFENGERVESGEVRVEHSELRGEPFDMLMGSSWQVR